MKISEKKIAIIRNSRGRTEQVELTAERSVQQVLTEYELKKLATAIVMRRLDEEKPEDIIGNVYILPAEEKESPTRDAKEFSTLLNACGRLGKASLGIGACLGDKKIKERAVKSMMDYKRELVNAMNWYERSKETERVIKGNGYIIVHAKDNIMPTIAGTIASILSKSGEIKEGTYILSMAQLYNGMSKASLRVSGSRKVDLREIVVDITKNIEGAESGGHSFAAGAIMPTAKENEFIDSAKRILSKRSIEEEIV